MAGTRPPLTPTGYYTQVEMVSFGFHIFTRAFTHTTQSDSQESSEQGGLLPKSRALVTGGRLFGHAARFRRRPGSLLARQVPPGGLDSRSDEVFSLKPGAEVEGEDDIDAEVLHVLRGMVHSVAMRHFLWRACSGTCLTSSRPSSSARGPKMSRATLSAISAPKMLSDAPQGIASSTLAVPRMWNATAPAAAAAAAAAAPAPAVAAARAHQGAAPRDRRLRPAAQGA